MQCPMCGSETRVVSTNQLAPGRTRRKVQCRAVAGHSFHTEEERVGWRLEKDVHIRHSGDDKIQIEPFDPARLHREVSEGVVGRLSPQEINNAVAGAIAQLKWEVLPDAKPVTGKEYGKIAKATGSSGPLSWIYDWQVREAVEYQLRKTNRIAHILYTLSFLGRPMKGKQGWRSAEDFLEWLYSDAVYPDLREQTPDRISTHTHRWPVERPGTLPKRVVKREGRNVAASKSGGSGGVVDFLESRFRNSIRMAFLGRPNAEMRSQYVSWWVLQDLVGQHRVHSSQLAAGVLQCLRQVDDIAYLRWAIQVKDLRAVREIKTEAIGLIEWPSERLRFQDHAPPRKPLRSRPEAGPADTFINQ